jgi:hypothetical protein
MSRRVKSEEDRIVTMSIALPKKDIARIDAVCAINERSSLIREWIMDALVQREQSITNTER